MHRSWARMAQQLNYTREFLSPVSVRINLPSGVPYEAFDSTGTKVQPWSLVRLFESLRSFMFWPTRRLDDPKPDGSLADFHKILAENFFFIASVQVKINEEFHDNNEPKFPLYAVCSLDHVGSSSKLLMTKIFHPSLEQPYATCAVTDVLVSSSTRKPTPYPDWFREKYVPLCTGEKLSPFADLKSPSLNEIHRNDWTVMLAETDSYLHTNWASYVKYCVESFNLNTYQGKYETLSKSHIDRGLKSMDLVYKNEASLADILTVESWEGEQSNTVEFNVRKDDVTCLESRIEFY